MQGPIIAERTEPFRTAVIALEARKELPGYIDE